MALKTFNPTTPSQRQLVIVDRSGLWKGKPVKVLTEGLTSKRRPQQRRPHHRPLPAAAVTSAPIVSSTSSAASLTSRARSSVSSTIRTARPSSRSSTYTDGEQAYILAPQRLAAGDKVIASDKAVDVKPGNTMPLAVHPGRLRSSTTWK